MSNGSTQADVKVNKEAVAAQANVWVYAGLFPAPADAANFANLPPAQGSGEAAFSVLEDGRTHLFIFGPFGSQ